MNMLIIVPVFSRILPLKWSIQSIFQALEYFFDKTGENLSVRVVFVDNGSPVRDELLRELRTRIRLFDSFPCVDTIILQRERPLPPVKSWYGAILSYAEQGDVVFLHGDDDLLTIDSLVKRWEAAKSLKPIICLTSAMSGLVFLDSGSVEIRGRCEKTDPEDEMGGPFIADDRTDIDQLGPAFIGNHTYIMSDKFRDALRLSFQWCMKTDWVDYNTKTLMLPYYLPFAAQVLGHPVGVMHANTVLRGVSQNEIQRAPFGSASWNPGFLAWIAAATLAKQAGELPSARIAIERQTQIASDWFPTFFFDSRVGPLRTWHTIKAIRFPNRWLSPKSIVRGLRLILGEFLHLRGVFHRTTSRRFSDFQQIVDTIL